MAAAAVATDKQKYFELLEEQRVRQEERKAFKKAVKTLPQSAMAQLGLEFDQFNPEAKCQMFIDKESAAHYSSDAESKDSNLHGSIQTQDSLEISAEQMCKVLELPSNKRSQEQLQRILPLFKRLDAFEKLQKLTSGGETIPDSFFLKILQICFVERYKKGQYVCHEGEKGDKFYINLHGTVQFLINDMDKTKTLTEMKNASEGGANSTTLKSIGTDSQNKYGIQQSKRNSVGTFNPNALAKHITSPINVTDSRFTSRPLSGRRRTQQNAAPGISNRLSLKTAGKQDPETIQANVQQDTINSKVSKPEDQDKKNNAPEINLLVMKELGRGGTGGMFGELAIKDPQAGRKASVKCLKNCIFIVLCGRDYSRYMRRLVEKLDDEKIEFLKTIPIFQNWAKGTMRSFLNNIKPHTYYKGHKILTQGEQSNFIYIVNKGTVGVSIKVKKPFSDIDSSVTMLRQEKYKLKDQIHGIQRHTRESLDQRNCLIEGDGSGMMGATDGWPKMHQGAEMYRERMEKHEQEHEEGILRQRLLVLDDKKDKISDAKRMYWNVDHGVTQLAAGQLFNEEGLIVKDSPSRYSITVTSEKAELWLISAFQLGKRVEMVPETRFQMTNLIKYKARQVYDLCRTQATWSLIDAYGFGEFYKQVFHKQVEVQDDDTMILEDNANNKQVQEETQVFYRQARENIAVRDKKPTNEQGEEIKVTGRQKILKRNLELLHAKVEEMDQVGCAVDLHPLKRGNLPQMENKKRYFEVQRVVSPNKNKGQKAHKIFKDDEFIQEAIVETMNYAKEVSMGGLRAPKVKKPQPTAAPLVPKVKQTAALINYENQLKKLKNIEGGGSLVSGHTLDQRAVMKEIVKGYPKVTQQIQIHLRDLALQMKDENGQPIHRTSEMLLNLQNSDIDDYTKFEKQLYETFDKSPDPMQLIKILKRKLSLGANGACNVKILEDMLSQEPLRKFVLFAKKCYLNNELFGQISKIHGMQGNEQAVYKNDIEYQTQMNLKRKPLPPPKMTYFQQSLQQKHLEAQYQSRQQRAQINNATSLNSINDRVTKTRQHKIELTIKPIQLSSHNQSQMLKQQPQTQNKTPIFESKELQKLFSSTEQMKQLTTPPQNDKDPRYLSQAGPNEGQTGGKSTVSLEIQKQDDLIKMIENDRQTESFLIMSEDRNKDNNTARITYQGDNKSSIDNDTQGLLDVKLVQADLKEAREDNKVSTFRKDNNVNADVDPRLSALDQSVTAIMQQETRRQSQPLFTGPISANFQIKRPATSLLQRHRQPNCVSPLAGSTMSGRTSQLKARQQIATVYGITNVHSGRQQIQHQQHTATQMIVREGGMNSSTLSTNNQRMASQLNHRPVNARSSGQYMVQSSGLESSSMKSEANLSRLLNVRQNHRNQARMANAKSFNNIYNGNGAVESNNRKQSQTRIGKRMPSTSMLDNLTATSSANYSRTGRMASQLNYHSKPKHIKMQVASLRKRAY